MTINSYLDADFPLDVKMIGGGNAMLFGKINDKVIGAVWYGSDPEKAWVADGRAWDGDGVYSAEHPGLNLVPPPGKVVEAVAEIQNRIDEIKERLDANLSAPAVWIESDTAQIAKLQRQIADLIGEKVA